MSKNIRTQLGKIVGKTLNNYHQRVKPKIDDLKFKEQYQGRIIDCMVGEVDDNYIETPETDSAIVKLEHSKEGLVKVPSIKGKTILVDADGNETDTPGEGCRLVSVGEDEDNKMIILSKNKNLVEKNNIIKGAINWGSDYNIFTDKIGNYNRRNIMFKECIRVEPNTTYYVQYQGDKEFHFMKYDEKGNHIIGEYPRYKNQIMTTDAKTHYINIYIAGGDTTVDYDLDGLIKTLKETFMIEKANAKNSFAEGLSHKTEILLNEPLRGLPNGVCDEIIGNKIIRRVGIGNLHNKFYIYNNADRFENTVMFLGGKPKNMKTNSSVKSNKLPTLIHWNRDEKGIFVDNDINIHIPKDELETLDDAGCLRWLSDNPTEVIYELEEPIIEELPNSIALQGFDNTTMYIENKITPTVQYGYNALIPYKQELLNQKEEVETNTLDIEQNIIPYLMDMEYNLMLMEDN